VASNDHFVALSECHFLNPQTMAEIGYYPNTSRWWASVDGVMRAWAGRDLTSEDASWPHPIASELIKYMDEAGVDVCFALREGMMDISGQTVALSTNAFMMQQIEPYPERMYLEAMVGPILRRGIDDAIWELEYLVKECDAKLCKVYQPEDLGPLDDRRMWPFYEKACELDIALTMHTGMSYVVPQPSCHTQPDTLDRVLLDFPELKIIAYHMGWPRTEELIGLAGKHQNLYLSLSGIVGWYQRSPYRGYHAIGTALQWVSHEKIVMGLDLPFDDTKRIVDYVRNLQMPEELQEKWGYPEITEEMRAGILGLNLARLAKIEPIKRVK
jgi:predicted TIM-barrel fold metal-dependent hydrolase